MLLTPHTLVGVTLGATISNPLIAVPLSIAMHFMGDLVPHWDFYSNTKKEERTVGWRPLAVMADFGAGIAIGLTATLFALWVKNDAYLALNIFMCGIAAVLPDALEGPHIFMKDEPKPLRLLSRIQSKLQFQAPLPWGAFSQVIICGFCLLLLSNLAK